jgi:putative GTP pyrophosphokinase
MFSNEEHQLIEAIVSRYIRDIELAERLTTGLQTLVTAKSLAAHIHSIRARTKDPEHLRDKLYRKLKRCKEEGNPFEITPENLFEKVNDLAGVRLLHLHTTQFELINAALVNQLDEEGWSILEGPEARVWDDEYRGYFESIGVAVSKSERLYTSVHYVVQPTTRTKRTAEIQVRTLAEELWGEVDHSINYPQKCGDVACEEQIKVLARVTSSCTRLVDSIFRSKREADERARREATPTEGGSS